MAVFSHIHRLLCRHCRHAEPLKCALKGKKACNKACKNTGSNDSAETHLQTMSTSPLSNNRAALRALRRAKEELERELAKFEVDDDEDDDNDNEQVQRHKDERMMPLDFLAELSGESQKTDVEPDFDFTPAPYRHSPTGTVAAVGAVGTVELPAAVPAELPTNIHWTDPTGSTGPTDSTSISAACTTAGRALTPPHARPFSLPPPYSPYAYPYPSLGKVRASDNLRQLARKSIGSPRESFYSLDASTTLSIETATVLCMTPSVPTLVTIRPARRRPSSPHLINGSAVPSCLEVGRHVGRHPSYRDSAARAHAVQTRRSLPPGQRNSDVAQSRYAQQETVGRIAPPPPTFDEILMRPRMPTLRRSPTALAYSPSASAAARFLLSSQTSAATTSIATATAFDSLKGRQLLHTLRQFLGIEAPWSPAQTLVFVLEHARTRSLAVSHGADTIHRVNVLSWAGVLRSIRGQQECERVARWLCSREALFTNRTSARSLLLPKAKKRVYVENESAASSRLRKDGIDSTDSTDSICIPTMLSQWAIENNPRRRYHQGWTGAGRSRLSECMTAE